MPTPKPEILAFCALLALGIHGQGAKHPNVLFIAVDDLNDWVGCLGGHPQAKTPNIDAHDAKNNTPLCNLFVHMLNQMNLNTDQFASSTGELSL